MLAITGRRENFNPALMEVGNQDADTIMPLLQPGEASASHEGMAQVIDTQSLRASHAPPELPRGLTGASRAINSMSLRKWYRAGAAGSQLMM